MKLCEFKAVDPDKIEFTVVNRDGQRMRDPVVFSVPNDAGPVRVEIHSLDDQPWPTERPEGWGVWHWCRFKDDSSQEEDAGLVIGKTQWKCDVNYTVLRPSNCSTRVVDGKEITCYGPRAEVPG